MQMKSFVSIWGRDFSVFHLEIEQEVNDFLATLPDGAVKFVQTATSATRRSDTDQDADQMESEVVITIWFEGKPKTAKSK